VLKALKVGDLEKARQVVATGKGMEERVLSDALGAYEEGPESVEEVASASLIRERQRYDRSVAYLGTVGSNGPFIGLLGTVIGIILSFSELGRNPKGGLEVVGPGISEALVSTAVGLLVAIPAVMAFNNLRAAVKKRVGNTEFLCKLLLGHMRSETRTPIILTTERDRSEDSVSEEAPAVTTPKGVVHGRALELG
jgi:biopolymer transport protein ExbB/TolQ